MSAWSDLPNADHIDWVMQSVKTHPELWLAAYDATKHAELWLAAFNTAFDAARTAARYAAWSAARDATWGDSWGEARSDPWNAARYVARGAIIALIAYDDCDQYLSMHSEQLHVWARLSEQPQAVLLLPMVMVREQIEQIVAT